MMTPINALLRDYESGDERCVLDSWWRGAQDCAHFAWLPTDVVLRGYRNYINWVVSQQHVRVHVLCDPDNRTQVFGWICGDENVIHWCYIKQLFRRNELAKMLVLAVHGANAQAGRIVTSHWSYVCNALPQYRIIYEPEKFFTPHAIAHMKSIWKATDENSY